MAKSKSTKKGRARARSASRKALTHVKARRVARVAKKQAKRQTKNVAPVAPVAGAEVERTVELPDIDNEREKDILDALDVDEQQFEDEVGAGEDE